MYRRFLLDHVAGTLQDTPVVAVVGARQTGKTTLVKSVSEHYTGAEYVTMDDLTAQSAAVHDPAGFIAGYDGLLVIDEVQRTDSSLYN